jgi:hypothetical protein
MHHWLGLDIYRRCALDTEFAQQTVNEASELSLERGIAMKYTTLGLYNLDLVMWKKANKDLCQGGYGYIPSSILHPYGTRDVLAPLRAYPHIKRQLEAQRLWDYYLRLHQPFVTDVFSELVLRGLPCDVELMDELRELFHFVRARLEVELKRRLHNEAKATIMFKLSEEGVPNAFAVAFQVFKADGPDAAMAILKPLVDMANMTKWIARVHHLFDSPDFNIRSPDQLRRWLFDVEELTPVKTTNQKAKGLPSMAWDKVLELPPERRKLYTPAVDKQTLQILSEELPALDELLNLNAVGNVCKAFLKEAEVYIDEETGEEVVEENGLHQWLTSLMTINCMYSLNNRLPAGQPAGETH